MNSSSQTRTSVYSSDSPELALTDVEEGDESRTEAMNNSSDQTRASFFPSDSPRLGLTDVEVNDESKTDVMNSSSQTRTNAFPSDSPELSLTSPVRYIEYRYDISIVDVLTLLKNIDIDMVIFENIDIDIDIDKAIRYRNGDFGKYRYR